MFKVSHLGVIRRSFVSFSIELTAFQAGGCARMKAHLEATSKFLKFIV